MTEQFIWSQKYTTAPQFSFNAEQVTALLTQGALLTIWLNERPDGIFEIVSRVDAEPDQTIAPDTHSVREVRVLSLQDGAILALWLSAGSKRADQGLFAQRFDGTGAPDGNVIRVTPSKLNVESINTVSATEGGGFDVRWTNENRAQLSREYGPDGRPSVPESSVSSGDDLSDQSIALTASVETITRNRAQLENEITGTERDDILKGGDDNDTIDGQAGNDRLEGGSGNDLLNGEAGRDKLFGQAGNDRLLGGDEVDVLNGGRGNDRLFGGGGNDSLFGGNDDDSLFGQNGRDTLLGGEGDDRLRGGFGKDKLKGENGADLLLGNDGDDRLYGGFGKDRLVGGTGDDLLIGGQGIDDLSGGKGRDQLAGGAGDDKLVGGDDGDYLQGGDGADRLYGLSGNDVLLGGGGKDFILGAWGSDTIYGGFGEDELAGMGGNDVVYGGAGDDKIRGGAGDDRLGGGAGNDQLSDSGGNNIFFGHTGDDLMLAGEGVDTFVFTNAGGGTTNLTNNFWGLNITDDAKGTDGHDTIMGLGEEDVLRILGTRYTPDDIRKLIPLDSNIRGAPIWIETGQGVGATDTVIHYDAFTSASSSGNQTITTYFSSITLASFGTDIDGNGGGEPSAGAFLTGLIGNFTGFQIGGSGNVLSLAVPGDWNNDGIGDLLLKDPLSGFFDPTELTVVYGAKIQDSFVSLSSLSDSDKGRVVSIDVGQDLRGRSSGGSDFNGDGRSDFLFPLFAETNEPSALIYTGEGDFDIRSGQEPEVLRFFAPERNSLIDASPLGDVNGDGRDDIGFDVGVTFSSDDVYTLAFVVLNSNIGTLTETMEGSGGFLITASSQYWEVGPLSNGGDVNGDGKEDILLSVFPTFDDDRSFVVFGKAGGGDVNLSDTGVKIGDGSQVAGYEISGATGLSGGGDFNGDGRDDIIATTVDSSSTVNIVFGKNDEIRVDLGRLGNSTQGIVINGLPISENGVGYSAEFGGDFNGDGLDEILLTSWGSKEARSAFVVYGTVDSEAIEFADIKSGEAGFEIRPKVPDEFGLGQDSVVRPAGDLNGDGFDDLVATLSDLGTYVIYGDNVL